MEDWIKVVIWLAIYMLVGIVALEFSWAQTKALREINEERDSKYPAFRRYDTQQWQKWKFYPGAVTLLPLRLVLAVVLVILCYLSTVLVCLGHTFVDDQPLRGCRAFLIKNIYKFYSSLLMVAVSMRSTRKKLDIDYSEYLGPDYKET